MCHAAPMHPEAGWRGHGALICHGLEELVASVAGFIERGVAAGEPTAAVFPGPTLERLRCRLGATCGRVRFEDMAVVGRNPGRILPLLQEFSDAHPRPVRILAQPLWPGRTEAETVEVMRHEALVNLAYPAPAATIVCAYDTDSLGPSIVAEAERRHPWIVRPDGLGCNSPSYAPPAGEDQLVNSLEPPQPPVEEIRVTRDLAGLRRQMASSALLMPLSAARRDDFILAVDEAATNALEHGEEPRFTRMWRTDASVVAEVVAAGQLDDPLAGRCRPPGAASRGRGLWIVNQLCDLVQLRQDGALTRLRLHMRVG